MLEEAEVEGGSGEADTCTEAEEGEEEATELGDAEQDCA